MKKLIATVFLIAIGSTPAYGQELLRTFKIGAKDNFLNLPIKEANANTTGIIAADGKVLDEFTFKLADANPDYWTFFDVTRYRGRTISLQIETATNAAGLNLVQVADTFPGQGTLYREKYRPQVTFSTRRGWTNDPNGLVYHDGEYHLFYQHNPYGWNWGNMHWGHAVSTDLLHWRELGDVLFRPQRQYSAFSGSAVVDAKNTAGFRRNGIDPILAFYTRTGKGESLALSYDKGRTFEEYGGNPLLVHNGRDPKVFWYEPGKHWVMVVYSTSQRRQLGLGQEAAVQGLAIYSSPDLKQWTYQSVVPGFFECPELFELEVEGQPGVRKWVMYDASGKYVVGGFDGKKFAVEQSLRDYDYGGDFYASQTYNNIPASDGRRIQVGWVRSSGGIGPAAPGSLFEGMPFNQKMTFPTSLQLRSTLGGLILAPTPVAEIAKLHRATQRFEDKVISAQANFVSPVAGDVMHVIARIDPGDAAVSLDVNGYVFTFDPSRSTLNNVTFALAAGEELKIEVIVDRVGIEAFINDGLRYFVKGHNSVDADHKIEVRARGGRGGGKAILRSLEVHELSSIWQTEAS